MSYNASTFFDEKGRLQGVFAAARDVTDLKRGEKRIRIAGGEAERANRAKSEFMSRTGDHWAQADRQRPKRDPDTAAIPVVIVTADAINAKPAHFMTLGAPTLLTNPIDISGHIDGLILLDRHLPDMNGDELLRQLRARDETKAIPVVMVSGDTTADVCGLLGLVGEAVVAR